MKIMEHQFKAPFFLGKILQPPIFCCVSDVHFQDIAEVFGDLGWPRPKLSPERINLWWKKTMVLERFWRGFTINNRDLIGVNGT